MMDAEEIDLLTVTYVKNKILSAAKIGLYSVDLVIPTKHSDTVESMLEKIGYTVVPSAGETDDTKVLHVSYIYPQKNSEEKNISSATINIMTAGKASDVAGKSFIVKRILDEIILKIEKNAKKGISDEENIVVEKANDVYVLLGTTALEYLKEHQISAYVTDDGSTVIFKPSKDR